MDVMHDLGCSKKTESTLEWYGRCRDDAMPRDDADQLAGVHDARGERVLYLVLEARAVHAVHQHQVFGVKVRAQQDAQHLVGVLVRVDA